MTTLSEVTSFISTLSSQRDSYFNTLVKVRELLGLTTADTTTTTAQVNKLIKERDSLKTDRDAVTKDRDGLKANVSALTVERDALKKALAAVPPVTPPTTVPGAGGTIVTGKFPGRNGFGAGWKTQFEDDFPMLTEMGQFLAKYGKWAAYPDYYFGTNQDPSKGGNGDHYSFDGLGVIEINGTTYLVSQLFPASITKDGKNWGSCPYPKWMPNGGSSAATQAGEMRVVFPDNKAGAHYANLLWNDKKPWATGGESDVMEFEAPGTLGCFFHFDGAKVNDGGDQAHFTSNADPTVPHVVGWEQIAGVSFRWFVDGVQQKPDNNEALMRQGLTDANGTIISRVPTDVMRIALQNELKPKNNLTAPVRALYDWITLYLPA